MHWCLTQLNANFPSDNPIDTSMRSADRAEVGYGEAGLNLSRFCEHAITERLNGKNNHRVVRPASPILAFELAS